MRALVVMGGAMLIGACSLGALDGFSGEALPDGGTAGVDAPTTAAYHAAVAADAPIAHFPLEEATGAACASTTTSTAVCVYPQDKATRGTPGIGGTKALHFDTTSSTLTISGLPGDFSSPYSVELWFRADVVDTTTAMFYFQDPGTGHPGPGLNLFVWDDNRLRTELWNADKDIAYGLTPTAITANAWHHVVIAHSTGPHEDLFYVDGQIVEHDTDAAATRPSVSSPFTLGGFVGSLDEIAVYDKALAPARVAAHYAAQ